MMLCWYSSYDLFEHPFPRELGRVGDGIDDVFHTLIIPVLYIRAYVVGSSFSVRRRPKSPIPYPMTWSEGHLRVQTVHFPLETPVFADLVRKLTHESLLVLANPQRIRRGG